MKTILAMIALLSAQAFAADCPANLLTGKYIFPDENAVVILEDGYLKDNKWADFNLVDPDSERPQGGSLNLVRNLPFEIEQVGCEKLIVTHQKLSNSWYGSGRTINDLKTVNEEITLEAIKSSNEKVEWTNNSFKVSSKVGNWKGWRKYQISVTKNADGTLDVKYNGSGYAPIPAPIPVYWKNSYKLIPVK